MGLNWKGASKELPEPYKEVLVLIDGHRGPSWPNSYCLVAFMNDRKEWWEERHIGRDGQLVGVVAWTEVDHPDISEFTTKRTRG